MTPREAAARLPRSRLASLLPLSCEAADCLGVSELAVLYAWWGEEAQAERWDPVQLKCLPLDLQGRVARAFQRFLTGDAGPLGLYGDGRIGWDSLDPQAEAVRIVYHFLRTTFDDIGTRRRE